MADITTSTVAPSAAPAAAAPVSPVAPVVSAPVAAPSAPVTLNDYAELARKSYEPAPTPAAPAPAPGQEPSPEPVAAAPAELSPEPAPALGDEPTAEEQENWTDGERRIHGALVKERAERKAAKAELAQLRTELDQLKQPAQPNAPKPAAPVPAAQSAPVPSTGELLADCMTFEAVEARKQQAAATQGEVINLMAQMLQPDGQQAVVAALAQSGITHIGTTPIAEAQPGEINGLLMAAHRGAVNTASQADARKGWIADNQKSLATAVQIIPSLGDPNSPEFKTAAKIVSENPLLRGRANWPELVVRQVLGAREVERLMKPAPAAPAPVKPAPKAAPGAPRRSTSAAPATSSQTALATKMANGTATLAEVQQYTRSLVTA